MKLTCSTFFVDNRDPGRCKNGDRFLVKVNGKKPMRFEQKLKKKRYKKTFKMSGTVRTTSPRTGTPWFPPQR